MFSFLKKIKKTSNKQIEPVYFVGKSSVDSEYIYIGEDEQHTEELKTYIDTLHRNILSNIADKQVLKQTPVYYFFDYNKDQNNLSVGRIGPNKDKSDRDNIFLLTRYVYDQTIQKYPLFTPSLYSDFFKACDEIVYGDLKHNSLQQFENRIKGLSQFSVYLANKEVLNRSMENLYDLSFEPHLESFPELKKRHLMGSWLLWRDTINLLEDKRSILPLLIELPFNSDLHHYISFICQLVEPLFEAIEHYRVFWWQDMSLKRSWCLISDFTRDPSADLMLFDKEQMKQFNVLNYTNKNIKDVDAHSLFDALQILIEN